MDQAPELRRAVAFRELNITKEVRGRSCSVRLDDFLDVVQRRFSEADGVWRNDRFDARRQHHARAVDVRRGPAAPKRIVKPEWVLTVLRIGNVERDSDSERMESLGVPRLEGDRLLDPESEAHCRPGALEDREQRVAPRVRVDQLVAVLALPEEFVELWEQHLEDVVDAARG
jgi:hypothetical protein